MPHRGLHTALAEVAPDLDSLIVAGGDEVGFVGAGVETDVADALVVDLHRSTSRWANDARSGVHSETSNVSSPDRHRRKRHFRGRCS